MIRNRLLYYKVIALRKKGQSYKKISKGLSVPKSTISDWLSSQKWSNSIKFQLIAENRRTRSNFLIRINRIKHRKTIERYNTFRIEAKKEYESLKQNKLFLAGLGLYWGEGEKTDNGRVGLINSDDKVVATIVNFFKKVLMVPEAKLRAAIFIYADNNKKDCFRYWNKITGIPTKQFIKTQLLPSRSKHTKRKVKNGICNVYFTDVKMNIKIREWIDLLAFDLRV